MKILQVLFSGLSGQASVVFSLLRGARGSSHSHVLIFFGVEELAPSHAATCAELGVPWHFIKKRRGLDLDAWRRFASILRSEAPDAVLLHSTNLILPAAKHRFARPAARLVSVEHTSPPVKRPVDWIFTTLALRLSDAVVCITDSYVTGVRARLGPLVREDRVHVIGNGIDTLAFVPDRTAPRMIGPTRVGMVGRFSTNKDHATLIRAAARLRRDGKGSGNGPRIKLVLVGDGITLDRMKRLAATLELSADDCEFLGARAEAELPAILRSLDIYVQSSFGEVMSTAVMQAMSVGLPVIASDVPGLSNMVRRDETGTLFPCGDDVKLGAAIERLSAAPAERLRLGHAASVQARRDWSQESMFSRYESLLRSLLADGAR